MLLQNNIGDIQQVTDSLRLVDHFSWWRGKKEIILKKNAVLHYLAILGPQSQIDIALSTRWEHAQATIAILVVPDATGKVRLDLQNTLLHHHCRTSIHIVTFLLNKSDADIQANILLASGTLQTAGHLLEENIIVWKQVKIKTLPMLDVRSNDVKASHGARIQTLDKKKLFYLQARGLADQEAKQLLIGGYFETIFWSFIHQAVHDKSHPELLALKNHYLRMVTA